MSKAVAWLTLIGLLLIGVGVFKLSRENYTLKLHALRPAPAMAVGVIACGGVVGLVVSNTNGELVEVTPHTPGAKDIVAVALSLPKEARISMPLELSCGAPQSRAEIGQGLNF